MYKKDFQRTVSIKRLRFIYVSNTKGELVDIISKSVAFFKLPYRVLLLSLAHGLDHLYSVALPPLFLLIQEDFAVSYTELGILVSLRAISGFLQPVVGIFVDRWGARLLLAWSFSVMAVSFLGMAYSPTFLILLAFQALQGVGAAVGHPASFTLVARLRAEQSLGRSMAFHSFGGHLGTTVGLFIIAVAGTFFGWKLTLALLSLPGFLFTLLLLRTEFPSPVIEQAQGGENDRKKDVLEEDPSAGKKSKKGRNLQSKYSLRPLLVLVLAGTFQGMFSRSLTSFLPTFLSSTYGFNIATAGSLSSIMYAGGLAGVLAGGELADRTDRVYLIAFLGGGSSTFNVFSVMVPFPREHTYNYADNYRVFTIFQHSSQAIAYLRHLPGWCRRAYFRLNLWIILYRGSCGHTNNRPFN